MSAEFYLRYSLQLQWPHTIIIERKPKSRVAFIEKYVFSISLKEKFKQKYPQLSEDGIQSFYCLKRFFFFCTDNHWHPMPSKVVDDAWHEFILLQRNTKTFVKVHSEFLHHTPAGHLIEIYQRIKKDGLKKVWKAACERRNRFVQPRKITSSVCNR